MMNRRSSTIVTATTLAVLFAGCGGDVEEAAPPEEVAGENENGDTGGEDNDNTTGGQDTGENDNGDDTGDDGSGDDGSGGNGDENDGGNGDGDGGNGGDDGDDNGDGDGDGDGAPSVLPTTPVEYADALVVAWGNSDHALMEQMATAEVVHILGDGGGPNWQQVDSVEYASATEVIYENSDSGDTLTLGVDHSTAAEGADHAVHRASYETADGGDAPVEEPLEYANSLVQAWGSGDRDTMERLGTNQVLETLADEGGPNWMQIGLEQGTHTSTVTYYNSDTGDMLTLWVDNEPAIEGADHAVTEAALEEAD